MSDAYKLNQRIILSLNYFIYSEFDLKDIRKNYSTALHTIVIVSHVINYSSYLLFIKLHPAIFPLSQHVIRFHELPADTTQRFLQ